MLLTDLICDELGKSEMQVRSFLKLAPNKYRTYTIPKRTTGKRLIAHPSKELKIYQYALIEVFLFTLPVHKSATAYMKGASIKNNASIHKESKYMLKMDFQNFFHSITPHTFFSYLDSMNIELSNSERFVLQQTLFWRPSKKSSGALILSIGAPTSPLISNLVMYSFDSLMDKFCNSFNIKYSRYADDLTFSTNVKGALFHVPEIVKQKLSQLFNNGITINERKTVFTSKKHNRFVTGITITNDEKLSIGRSRKRYISSLIHKFKLGLLNEEDARHLKGLLAFASDVEPMFRHRMIQKYSLKTLDKLKAME